jgi:hypothetical protein
MVAPLTTALMRSVPGRQAGLASAINNAISRVGPQLAGALIFIIVFASFYGTLQALLPGLDLTSPGARAHFPPLNQPINPPLMSPQQLFRVAQASTEAFHLAMITAAGLLVAGAAVNGLFISNRQALGVEGTPPG